MCRRSFSFCVLLSALASIAPGAEPIDSTKRLATTSSKLSVTSRDTIDAAKSNQKNTGASKNSGDAVTLYTPYELKIFDFEPEESAESLPYHYFDPADPEKSTLTAYLLSQLSMKVYSGATTEGAFKQHLVNKLTTQGIEPQNINVLMDADSGTEGAAFTIGETVVIAFRGTSTEGTQNINSSVDVTTDINDDPWPVEINNKEFFVHVGFWDSVDAVYGWILEVALQAKQENKSIWLTGHSLGGARATIAALRLHYEAGIDVDGLMTFGSPKTGDEGLVSMFDNEVEGGWSLADVTTRFVVHGDPATTFPEKEQIGVNFFTGWVYYEHVGTPITIFPFGNGSDFEIVPGQSSFVPSVAQWIGFLTGAGHSEHMWYDDALLQAVIDDPQYNSIQAVILDHQSVVQ